MRPIVVWSLPWCVYGTRFLITQVNMHLLSIAYTVIKTTYGERPGDASRTNSRCING